MYKKAILAMQKNISLKYPEYRAKFFINHKNRLIHIGMDRPIYEFSNYRLFLWDCEWFLQKELKQKFQWYRIPTLVLCTKWKYDYVCAIRI